ncbi:rod shape-determining protein [Nannocystis pusilla]|uniref:Rod shape-determining protein n=1 Tax=Nannocystis pusilla TaxID=889268 RepID=A0A9X3EY39_9BACT|nr:rod shape-determining protein [Nannocystis pusilla]MCY1012499.1 rod shape-determining protein [Nannocystis pusilla]
MIEPRVEEILLMAQEELLKSGMMEMAGSGIVLTGGGSQMEGMTEIVEDVFQMPVRRGVPVHGASFGRGQPSLTEGGFAQVIQDPKFSTGVGLVLYGAAHQPMAAVEVQQPRGERRPGIGKRFVGWMRDMF